MWSRNMIWMFTICKWYQSILVWSNSFVDLQFQFLADVITEINTIWFYFNMFQFFHINCSVLRRLDFALFKYQLEIDITNFYLKLIGYKYLSILNKKDFNSLYGLYFVHSNWSFKMKFRHNLKINGLFSHF